MTILLRFVEQVTSLKSTTKNMAFRIWFYFLLLTGIMLLFLWMLQISFIGPYYERNRSQTIQMKVTEIERLLERSDISIVEEATGKILTTENMCISIYNDLGVRTYIGENPNIPCQLNNLKNSTMKEYMIMADNASTHDFSINFNNGIHEQGMYFYGRSTLINGKPNYIFVISPIKLLDSTVFVLKRQFGLLALVVFSVATIVAFILSKRLSSPITKITNSAKKLADGDLSVDFEGNDYSEVETLASTLNYATQEFRKTDELRRDLVANVSHDIKTPLTMIKAYAEMIQDISGDNPEMREQHLNVIVDEVNHLERLVNDMLTLSKYEANVFDIKETEYFMLQQIRATTHLFLALDLHFEIHCDPNLMVVADEIKMGQVLYNYINNATKYVGNDNVIVIKADVEGDLVVVSVTDHGIGISPDIIDHIWDRYYKIDKNYQRSGSSSGLGLSIVKAICDASGSKYWVESELGVGTSFFYSVKKAK